jgi:hypothetical protein
VTDGHCSLRLPTLDPLHIPRDSAAMATQLIVILRTYVIGAKFWRLEESKRTEINLFVCSLFNDAFSVTESCVK